MATATQTNVTTAIASAQKLQVLALQVYNDASALLNNQISQSQLTINAATGNYQAPNMQDIAGAIDALAGQLTFIDNQILKLQQSAVVPT